MTDPIKAKIQELCPDVIQNRTAVVRGKNGEKETLKYQQEVKQITLAVVLRAIGKTERGHLFARADGKTATFFKWNSFAPDKCHAVEPTWIEWNLEHDNYDQQSEECKQFIHSLLGV